jgi:hypothetical protein
MRNFIYKIIIATIFLIIFFEFTIGKRIDPITQSIDMFSNKEGRKELIEKLRQEMRDGLEKEYLLKKDDRILIFKFFNKLQSEINSDEKN